MLSTIKTEATNPKMTKITSVIKWLIFFEESKIYKLFIRRHDHDQRSHVAHRYRKLLILC